VREAEKLSLEQIRAFLASSEEVRFAGEKMVWDLQSQRTTPSFFIGLIHLGLGQHDKALDYLEASVNEHAHWSLFFKVDPLCSIRCGAHTASSICWTELGFPNSPKSFKASACGTES